VIVHKLHLPHISLPQTFIALRHPNYRLWFFGLLISFAGSWMQSTAQGYLVYDLTQSAAYLGYIGFAAGIPAWLFTLYGGVVADHVPRRTLILITQTVMMMLAFVLAGLVFSGIIQPWHIVVLAFLLGIANAFDITARQAFLNELVPRRDLTNAIALGSTLFNLALIVGPALAGFTYSLVGPGWCFALNGISYLGVIGALLLMKLQPAVLAPRRGSVFTDLKDGFAYVRADQSIVILLIGRVVMGIFLMGVLSLLPAWAVKILGGDVTTNGMLYSARGVGAVIGALVVASLSRKDVRGRIWMISYLALPFALLGFALLHHIWAAMVLIALIGATIVTTNNTCNAIIQMQAPDELRGRVMAFFVLVFTGSTPLGSLLAGELADRFGEPAVAVLSAAVLFLYAASVRLWKKEIQDLP